MMKTETQYMCLTLHIRHKLLKVTQRHLANQAAPGWNNAFLCGAEEALNWMQ